MNHIQCVAQKMLDYIAVCMIVNPQICPTAIKAKDELYTKYFFKCILVVSSMSLMVSIALLKDIHIYEKLHIWFLKESQAFFSLK